jgi:hypothetical protein
MPSKVHIGLKKGIVFSLCFLIFLWNKLSGKSKESGMAGIE